MAIIFKELLIFELNDIWQYLALFIDIWRYLRTEMFTDESRKLSPNGNRALNIDSIRNLSDLLANQIIGNVDVLVIFERKFDVSFPVGQFKIPGFSNSLQERPLPIWWWASHFCERESIPAKHLCSQSTPIKGIYIKLNFHKKNWLL